MMSDVDDAYSGHDDCLVVFCGDNGVPTLLIRLDLNSTPTRHPRD